MTFSLEGIICLLAGVAITVLYKIRRSGLKDVSQESFPELDKSTFLKLKNLLDTSYERTLYLGVSFFFLAYAAARSSEIKAFAIILTLGVFIYNIPPRNKTMKLLASANMSPGLLRERGIRL